MHHYLPSSDTPAVDLDKDPLWNASVKVRCFTVYKLLSYPYKVKASEHKKRSCNMSDFLQRLCVKSNIFSCAASQAKTLLLWCLSLHDLTSSILKRKKETCGIIYISMPRRTLIMRWEGSHYVCVSISYSGRWQSPLLFPGKDTVNQPMCSLGLWWRAGQREGINSSFRGKGQHWQGWKKRGKSLWAAIEGRMK